MTLALFYVIKQNHLFSGGGGMRVGNDFQVKVPVFDPGKNICYMTPVGPRVYEVIDNM